jgi:hypothetical protein
MIPHSGAAGAPRLTAHLAIGTALVVASVPGVLSSSRR